jgi:hypothetical protein
MLVRVTQTQRVELLLQGRDSLRKFRIDPRAAALWKQEQRLAAFGLAPIGVPRLTGLLKLQLR